MVCTEYSSNSSWKRFGERSVNALADYACEPFPSRDPVTLPASYIAQGERLRGAVIGIGACVAAVLVAWCLKDLNNN